MLSTPEISRKQAWCKLAVLIAEGLSAPEEISFHPDGCMLHIKTLTQQSLTAWAEALGGREDTPIRADDGDLILGAHAIWHGYWTKVYAYIKEDTDAEPVDEAMTAVAAIAAGGES